MPVQINAPISVVTIDYCEDQSEVSKAEPIVRFEGQAVVESAAQKHAEDFKSCAICGGRMKLTSRYSVCGSCAA